ncbi:MAG: hypothetical protein AAF481_11225 [Acidobacteriota bacterium]
MTHPLGYDGSPDGIRLNICLAKGSEAFSSALARAIATWNALVPTTGNCSGTGCSVGEETPPAATQMDAESVLLHELGHCALGLEHPERTWDAADDGFWEETSFTRSWDVAGPPEGIAVGPDFIRGTLDDSQLQTLGMIPNSVSWFRIQDNNPFAIDDTVIDNTTFSRSITANLPSGRNWAASANRRTGEQNGAAASQAVMYGLISLGERRRSLTADDVNMAKMALTGVDFSVGGGDDYTVELVLSCDDPVSILVSQANLANPQSAGQCIAGVDYSFAQNPFLARHFTLVAPPKNGGILFLTLNQNLDWDYGADPVFVSGFESGDTSEWSQVVPTITQGP